MNYFGINLYYLREKQGITRKKLANFIKINEKTIQRWESGESEPTLTQFITVCRFFAVGFHNMIYVNIKERDEIIRSVENE